MADYIFMMETRLTPDQLRGVNLVQEIARAHEMNIYLVGGVVRDIIGGAAIHDLDFAVQGNALKLQKDLERAGAQTDAVDEHYRSLHVLLPGNVRAEISSTRSEAYDKPGKPPEITPGTITDDLRRRDFTVNAMALSLNPGSRGLLLDPSNGVADIESKLIRILHNYSFLEEPSRLIRATRFAARFEWTLEERTQARYEAAKENDYIQYVNKRNLVHEIQQVALENVQLRVVRALEKEGWLKVLNPHWSVAKVDVAGLNHLMKLRQQMLELGYSMDAGPAVMHFLTDKLGKADISTIQAMIPSKSFVQNWNRLDDDVKELSKQLTGKEAATNSQTWNLLTQTRPEKILITAALTKNKAAERKISDFLGKWRQLRARLPFPEMAEMRITPELPDYPKIAQEAFLLMLDGKLRSHNEIVKFLQPYSPPEPEPVPAPRRGRAKKAEAQAGAAPASIAAKGKRGRKPAQPEQAPAPAPPAPEPVTKSAVKAPTKAKAAPAKAVKSASKKKPAKKAVSKPGQKKQNLKKKK
jgi:tRNA nucleotidyltransferase/poly(A) polymerase